MCYRRKTDSRNHARQEVTFSLDQPEDREQMLDFTFNRSETQQQIEEDVFRGFSTEDSEPGEYGLKLLYIHNDFLPEGNIKFDFSFSIWESGIKDTSQRWNTGKILNTTVGYYADNIIKQDVIIDR